MDTPNTNPAELDEFEAWLTEQFRAKFLKREAEAKAARYRRSLELRTRDGKPASRMLSIYWTKFQQR